MNKSVFILVTGASGQLGRRLVRRLISHGYKLRAHYRSVEKAQRWCPPEAEPVFGDLLTPDWLHGAVKGCDIVIHCAAKVSLRPLSGAQRAKSDYMHKINVGGAKAVIEACLSSDVKRLIHISTVGAVGASVDGIPIDERASFNLAGYGIPYFETKYQAEKLALRANGDSLEVVVVNPSIMISPPDRELTRNDLKKIPRWLPVYFNFGINLVETDDVINGIVRAIDKGRPGQRYILAGEDIDQRKALSLAQKYLGIRKPLVKIPLWGVYLAGLLAESFYLFKDKKPALNRAIVRLAKLKFFYTSQKAEQELGYNHRPLEKSIEDILKVI
jgi:dihydroflavonol-4-reductase